MRKRLVVIILLSITSLNLYGQDCFEIELNIKEVDTNTRNLEFVVFYENDSIKKLCWWKKGTFQGEFYTDKSIIRMQIVKAQPIEYVYDGLSLRGHAISNGIYIDEKKFEFYTLCD